MARVPFNTTIEAGTKEALDGLAEAEGTTYGRLVDSMVVFYRDRAKLDIGQVASRLDLVVAGMQRIEDKVVELLASGMSIVEAPAAPKPPFDAVRDLVAAVPGATEFPFHPTCNHCGETFGAFNRFASVCSPCKKLRHVGDPRNCDECILKQGGA